jgi:arginine/ornithine N-succinyltransferase beta subunit
MPTNEVDIFDAGPLVRGQIDQLRTVRQARTVKVRSAFATVPDETPRRLLANGQLDEQDERVGAAVSGHVLCALHSRATSEP